MSVISNLTCAGFDTKYPSLCVDHLHTLTFEKNREQLHLLMIEWFEIDKTILLPYVKNLTYFEVKYTLYYWVQSVLYWNKHLSDKAPYDFFQLLTSAITKAKEFVKTNEIGLQEFFNPESSSTNSKSQLTTKQLSFNIFKQHADMVGKFSDINSSEFKKQVMDVYKKELDTSLTGLQSYYYASKKQYIESHQ